MTESKKNYLRKFTPVIVVIILVGIYFLSLAIKSDNPESSSIEKTNPLNNLNILNQDQEIDLGNGLFLSDIPSQWEFDGREDNAINTIKFGSPATHTFFVPKNVDPFEDPFGPTIFITTFIIDERLSASDIVNLIQEKKIADQINDNSDECLTRTEDFEFVDYDTYSFIDNTTSPDKCSRLFTEPGIFYTFLMKNQSGSNVLMASMSVTTNKEYELYLSDFKMFADNIRY